MEMFLPLLVLFLTIIVATSFINEKTIKLPTEIALLSVSLVLGAIFIFIMPMIKGNFNHLLPLELINEYLIQGVLCFMLFSGSYQLSYTIIKSKLRAISLLALIGTLISALVYGVLTFALFRTLGMNDFSFMQCFLIGCIVSPTDPIAAMSILNKVGLPKEIGLVIEGESLFNDGVGIALYAVVSLAIEHHSGLDPMVFSSMLFKEVVGAIVLGFVISWFMYQLFCVSSDNKMKVIVSLLCVSTTYLIGEYIEVSSAIASVVCGITFASGIEKNKQTSQLESYYDFWEVVDTLLNYCLYVILGLSVIHIIIYAKVNLVAIVIALLGNIFSRFMGVFIVGFDKKVRVGNLSHMAFTKLFTWAGLKGALCLALAIDSLNFFETDSYHKMLVSVFAIVLFTTFLQGLSIGGFYKKYYSKC